jgi:hypothetical protein
MDKEWWMSLVYAGFAGFGGAMGYIMRAIDAHERISKWRVMLEGGAAAFVGVIVMFLCQAMNFSAQWTGVVVGVCGWLGATSSIRLLERVISRKLGAEEAPYEHHAGRYGYGPPEGQDPFVDRVHNDPRYRGPAGMGGVEQDPEQPPRNEGGHTGW